MVSHLINSSPSLHCDTDFLHVNKGLPISTATWVINLWGLGGGCGVIAGGAFGQLLYNRRRWTMPIFIGSTVASAALPIWWLTNADLVLAPLGLVLVIAWLGGLLASTAAPNIRAVLTNCNEPETRGVALALQTMMDDVGKGLGPGAVAVLISRMGRQTAFNVSIFGWLPCGGLLAACCLAIAQDEDSMQHRLTMKVHKLGKEHNENEAIQLAE